MIKVLGVEKGYFFFRTDNPKEGMVLKYVCQGYGSVLKVASTVILRPNEEHLWASKLAAKIVEEVQSILRKLDNSEE